MNKKILITVTRIVTKNIHMDSQEFVRDNSKALYYKDLRLRLTSVSHPCARVIEPPEPKVVGSNPALLKRKYLRDNELEIACYPFLFALNCNCDKKVTSFGGKYG